MGEEKGDLARHFSPEYTVPVPAASAKALRDVDRLGTIGAEALRSKGYFTRLVIGDRKTRKVFDASKSRVLIVEDDEGTALLIEKALHSMGCQTLRARNLPEIAAALSGKRQPHLVLLDALLPDANGFDVLNRIRQHPQTENLPVLMLTALGDRAHVTRGLQLGANGYLTKPILPSALLEAIEATIAG
jgi:CheY-like chemotaxis protein